MKNIGIYMKKIIAAVLTGTMLFACIQVSTVIAKSDAELKAEQNKIDSQIKSIEQQIAAIKDKKQDVAAEVEELDALLVTYNDELNDVEARLSDSRAKLEVSKANLETATKNKENQLAAFSSRVRFIHENGSVGYLDIILEAESFNDFLSRLQYVNDIMEFDSKMLDELKATEETIISETAAIQAETDSIEALAVVQRSKTADLEKLVKEKESTIKSYENDAAKKEKYIQQLENASLEIERMLQSEGSSSSTSTYSGGKFCWPVPSKAAASSSLSSGFVSRNSPVGRGREFHSGYDIPASKGADIVAAEAGTVITSGWVNGYGYTIIIDHGGGLTTLYGHNSKLVVSKGDKVTRGQVVAKCGSTGWSTGNHCHFEVRLNGKATSPEPYLGVKNVAY